MMSAMKDGSHLYEVERRAQHAARPGFRIQELQLSKTQKVPWHYHNNVQDTFYVLDGQVTGVQQAVGTKKTRTTGAKYLSEFVEDVKRSGLVARTIEKHGVRGVTVAP